MGKIERKHFLNSSHKKLRFSIVPPNKLHLNTLKKVMPICMKMVEPKIFVRRIEQVIQAIDLIRQRSWNLYRFTSWLIKCFCDNYLDNQLFNQFRSGQGFILLNYQHEIGTSRKSSNPHRLKYVGHRWNRIPNWYLLRKGENRDKCSNLR